MSNNIISRLNSHLLNPPGKFGPGINLVGGSQSLKNDGERPSALSRYIGGSARSNQPYISGYHHVWFKLPSGLYKTNVEEHAAMWLRSTCESFTPHSSTLNLIDVQGIGQLGSSFPASKTVNREFTLAFREYQNLPILNILRVWHAIFDQHIGVSPIGSSKFIPINYKGWVVVAIVKPTFNVDSGTLTVEDLEEAYIYDGVVPMTVPEDTIGAAEQTANDSVQASVSFRFDGAPLDLSIPDVGIKVASLFAQSGSYYERYTKKLMDSIPNAFS
jgi:hypothetical protein